MAVENGKRTNMLSIEAALCLESGVRDNFRIDSNPYLSGFHEEEGGEVLSVRCLLLPSLLSDLQIHHVDLFVLDCEGCEKDVLISLYQRPPEKKVEVDVWLIEANHPVEIYNIMKDSHSLAACIGDHDMVWLRKGSDPWQQWNWKNGIEEDVSVLCPNFKHLF